MAITKAFVFYIFIVSKIILFYNRFTVPIELASFSVTRCPTIDCNKKMSLQCTTFLSFAMMVQFVVVLKQKQISKLKIRHVE